MKSKVRKICVHSDQYHWTVVNVNAHTIRIKIWKDGFKKHPWVEVLKTFNDPWVNFPEFSKGKLKQINESATPVTPKLISQVINKANEMKLLANSGPHQLIINEGHLCLELTDV